MWEIFSPGHKVTWIQFLTIWGTRRKPFRSSAASASPLPLTYLPFPFHPDLWKESCTSGEKIVTEIFLQQRLHPQTLFESALLAEPAEGNIVYLCLLRFFPPSCETIDLTDLIESTRELLLLLLWLPAAIELQKRKVFSTGHPFFHLFNSRSPFSSVQHALPVFSTEKKHCQRH